MSHKVQLSYEFFPKVCDFVIVNMANDHLTQNDAYAKNTWEIWNSIFKIQTQRTIKAKKEISFNYHLFREKMQVSRN